MKVMLTNISFIRLLLLAILITVAAQAIHETGHMIVYQLYHRNPTWGFIGMVQRWGTPPKNPNYWVETSAPGVGKGWLRLDSLPDSKIEKGIEAAAGPIASLLSVILGLLIAYKSDKHVFKQIGLMLALVISFSMSLYYLRSPLRTFGDEYNVAIQLNIPKALVEIPLALAFVLSLAFGLHLLESWHVRLKWLAAILIGSVSSGILLMYADGYVRESVNNASPFFQSVFGYSLPVLIVYLLAFFSIFIWQCHEKKELTQP